MLLLCGSQKWTRRPTGPTRNPASFSLYLVAADLRMVDGHAMLASSSSWVHHSGTMEFLASVCSSYREWKRVGGWYRGRQRAEKPVVGCRFHSRVQQDAVESTLGPEWATELKNFIFISARNEWVGVARGAHLLLLLHSGFQASTGQSKSSSSQPMAVLFWRKPVLYSKDLVFLAARSTDL